MCPAIMLVLAVFVAPAVCGGMATRRKVTQTPSSSSWFGFKADLLPRLWILRCAAVHTAASPRLSFSPLLSTSAPFAGTGVDVAVDTRFFVTSGASEAAPLAVTPGRPKIGEIFDEVAATAVADGEREVAVLFCGPSAMGSDVRTECARHSQDNVSFLLHEESFEL